MTIAPLPKTLKSGGVDQQSLVTFLGNVRDLVNELQADHATNKTTVDEARTAIIELIDDHATFKTIVDELKTDYTALLADVTAIRSALVATHAKLDLDGGVTDTDYASTNDPAALTATSIAASSPATLTAGDPTASAATLTNVTALTLNKG